MKAEPPRAEPPKAEPPPKPEPKAAAPPSAPVQEPVKVKEPAKVEKAEEEKPVDATERMRDSQRLAALAMPGLVLVGAAGTHRIGPGEHVVGRVDSCAVVVKETKISRQHATLQVTPAGCFVKDLGSANGSFLNGKKLGSEPVALKDGDKLAFADALFTVQVK